MNTRDIVLNPNEAAALTRLVVSYCLGKGNICLSSRSYALQLAHPKSQKEYTEYQVRRMRQFLPTMGNPFFYELHHTPGAQPGSGQWRARISCRYLETPWRLLYPEGEFMITSQALELVGAEAMASLWADRGRILMPAKATCCTGRLNLSRYTFESAELVHDWLYTLTGAEGRVSHAPNRIEKPMIYYDTEACMRLVKAMSRTWMAQAPCLAHKFRTPIPGKIRKSIKHEQDRLAALALMPQTLDRRAPVSLLRSKGEGRRIPGADKYLPKDKRAPEPVGSLLRGRAPEIRKASTDQAAD